MAPAIPSQGPEPATAWGRLAVAMWDLMVSVMKSRLLSSAPHLNRPENQAQPEVPRMCSGPQADQGAPFTRGWPCYRDGAATKSGSALAVGTVAAPMPCAVLMAPGDGGSSGLSQVREVGLVTERW